MMPEPLQYRILGPLEVTRGGETIVIGRQRLRAVLGCLLLGTGETLAIPGLVDAVWGPAAPSSADSLVRVYVSQLRQLIGDDAVLTRPGGYALADPGERLDAERFRRLVADARRRAAQGDDEGAARSLTEALALWTGEVLADTPLAGTAAAASEQLAELRRYAIEERAAAELRLGHHHEVVAELEREASANPTRERLVEELMVALYRSGRQADALELYAAARRRLVDERGLEPGRRLQELQAQILRHDPDLAVPIHGEPSAPVRPKRRSALVTALAAVGVAAGIAGWIFTRASAAPSVGPNAVVRIDTTHARVARVADSSGRPGAVLVTNQEIWVVDVRHLELDQLDPQSLEVRRRVSLSLIPHALVDADGRLWLANGFDGTISRLSPRGAVGPSRRPEPHSTGRLALASGKRALWIGSQDGRLTRLDARSGRAVAIIHGIQTPQAITVADGAVWVAQATSVSILRVDARTNRVDAQVPIGGVPAAIVSAAGWVWALAPAEGKLWQIDPRRNTVVASLAAPGATLLASAGRTLWVADGPAGTITRLLPRPATTISLSQPLASLAGGPTAIVAITN